MSHSYTTALSHILLAGTGIYCITRYHSGGSWLHMPCGTFGIIITHSLIGVWRWGHPDYGENAEKPYVFTKFLQTLFALPLVAGQVWINGGYQKELGYLHPGLSLIPLAAYLCDKGGKGIIDLLIAVNCVSCGLISYWSQEYYGIAAAVAFAINHFVIESQGDILDIPSQDVYNYAMCFFTYFAYRGLIN